MTAGDRTGATIGGKDGQKLVAGVGGGDSYITIVYYAPLFITPEAQNGDYIQFTIAQVSWTTNEFVNKTSGLTPGCQVGGLNWG